MKTLVFNGSPRKNGDTAFLIDKLREHLDGEVKVVETYGSSIRPCNDCRYCWTNLGCSINDEMQEIYEYIKECDVIVIASPLYFSELTGTLLSVCSRLQTFYASKRFMGARQVEKEKQGVIILCGGGDGGPAKAEETAKTLMKLMNAKVISKIYSLSTDKVPSKDDFEAVEKIVELAKRLNQMDEK